MDGAALEHVQEPASRAHAAAGYDPQRDRSALQQLSRDVGNRGFARLVSRMGDGEGVMSGGLVHPHVEAAIAASRGRGQRLDAQVTGQLEPALGEPLSDVRVHTGEAAAAMARAVSARAFTVGNDIFFGTGEYRPGNRAGNQLIAHEVAHTIQQRGAPTTGPLMVSQPGDALEHAAETVARDVAG